MKGLLIAGLIVVLIIVSIIVGIISRGADTASKVADKTVFNEDKIVYSYEEFHKKYEAYQQYKSQQETVEASLKDLESKGLSSGQRYDNLLMEASGARQMRNRIAADYNAMSKIAYQGVWKDKGLPEKLD